MTLLRLDVYESIGVSSKQLLYIEKKSLKVLLFSSFVQFDIHIIYIPLSCKKLNEKYIKRINSSITSCMGCNFNQEIKYKWIRQLG